MKKFIFILFILTTSFAQANVPIPRTVMDADDILNEVRGEFENKIKQLSSNYISHVLKDHIIYSSHSDMNCSGTLVKATQPLTQIHLGVFPDGEGKLVEVVDYKGCDGLPLMQEVVVTKGSNLKPATINEIYKGSRVLKLKDNETFRSYQLYNGLGNVMFSITQRKEDDTLNVDYFYGDGHFLNTLYVYESGKTSEYFTLMGYQTVIRHFGGGESRIGFGMDTKKLAVIVETVPRSNVIYLNKENMQVSVAEFQKYFNQVVKTYTLETIAKMLTYYLKVFPSTTTNVGVGGGKNERILNELKLAQIRLTGGTELNLVKDLVLEYIQAIESGKIIIDDQRSEK